VVKVKTGPDLSDDLLIGMAEAMAFSRIDKLVQKERSAIKRASKLHPGSQSSETSERLRALVDARSLFGRQVDDLPAPLKRLKK
jgi:hypothetical protein